MAASSSLSHSRHNNHLGMQKYFEFLSKLGRATHSIKANSMGHGMIIGIYLIDISQL